MDYLGLYLAAIVFILAFLRGAYEKKRELEGYMHDDEGGGKVYLDAGELRELASACNQAADWLDKRAESVPNIKVRSCAIAELSNGDMNDANK
jgi:hypothetical protein